MSVYSWSERERMQACVWLQGYALHARCDASTHTHAQDGRTALLLACYEKQEAAAAELMEATKRAGALDQQVAHKAWVRACVV